MSPVSTHWRVPPQRTSPPLREAHTLTALAVIVIGLVYTTIVWETPDDTAHNLKRCIMCFETVLWYHLYIFFLYSSSLLFNPSIFSLFPLPPLLPLSQLQRCSGNVGGVHPDWNDPHARRAFHPTTSWSAIEFNCLHHLISHYCMVCITWVYSIRVYFKTLIWLVGFRSLLGLGLVRAAVHMHM